MTIAQFFSFALICFLQSSCLSSLRTIKSRDLSAYARDEGAKVLKRPIKEKSKNNQNQIFVRKKKFAVVLKEQSHSDSNGSLFVVSNKGNQLFSTFRKPSLRDFIKFKIVSKRDLGSKNPQEKSKNIPKITDDGEKTPDSFEDDLLKSLPSLEPSDLSARGVIKILPMQVTDILPNGDLLLAYERISKSKNDSKSIKVIARLPEDYLDPSRELTTNHLVDIKLMEQSPYESLEKESTSWQDEYTLRVSGFHEAESKIAAELEVKRRELMDIKNKLHKRIQSLGAERRSMAKEREKLIKKGKDSENKVAEMTAKIEEQDKKLSKKDLELKEKQLEIENLTRAEEKPEDNEVD